MQHQRNDTSTFETVDPDVDMRAARRARPRAAIWPWWASLPWAAWSARTAATSSAQAWPTPTGGFPWATFAININGCALIGVLMVLVTDVWLRRES